MKERWIEACGSPDSIRVDYNRTLSDMLDEGWHEYGLPVWTNVKRDDGEVARCFAQQFVMTEREHDARHKETAGVASVPDWDEVPDWAEWLAQDRDGSWWAFENKPVALVNQWDDTDALHGCVICVGGSEPNPDWASTLVGRPSPRPSWDDAPDWAQWLAQDEDGRWYWYEKEPARWSVCWMRKDGTNTRLAGQGKRDARWADTLTRRPQTEPDWEDAPEWAEWLAQDRNGAWYWYEERPYKHEFVDEWVPQDRADQEGGVYTRFDKVSNGEKNPDWASTLERRPPGKPDWEDAPDWAEWLAQDKDGKWYWFLERPRPSVTWDEWQYDKGDADLASDGCVPNLDWQDTLEHRPQPEPEPEQEPLPCPFCGSKDVRALIPMNGQRARTQCLGCLAVIYADSKQESVRLWNRRTGCDCGRRQMVKFGVQLAERLERLDREESDERRA